MSGSAVPANFEETHIRQILQSVDIVGLISSYVSLKPQGKDHVGLCPFHNDHRPSMFVSPAKQIFKCFSCGAGGNVIQFMMLREHLTFPEAIRLLADRAGIQLPQRRVTTQTGADRTELEKVNRWAARFFRKLYLDPQIGLRAREYAKKRGISDEFSQKFGLGWAPDSWDSLVQAAKADQVPMAHLVQLGLLIQRETGGYYDRFRERLIFPVLDSLGRVIAFGGRTLGDDPAKYLNSPESPLFDKSRSLYGIYAAKDSIVKQKSAVVVEGYTDCIMAHQMGVSNVVATLGTALTDEHAQILSRYTEKIVLMFDGDAAGQKAADRATDIFFKYKMQVSITTLSDNRDPCDFLLQEGPEAFLEQIGQATDALDFKWRQMRQKLETEDGIKGRTRAVEIMLELVADATLAGGMEPISQGFLLNRVARLVERPVGEVHRAVARIQARKRGATQSSQTIVRPGAPSLSFDGLTNAWQELIEVLLNQSSLFSRACAQWPEPAPLEDAELEQIARLIWDCYRSHPQASLGEVLAGCQSASLCARVTDLAERGSRRSNFELTLDGALAFIQRQQEKIGLDEIRRIAVQGGGELGPEVQDAMLQELQQRLQSTHRVSSN